MYGSELKLEVPRTGGIISSNVLPDNGQLELWSDNLPDNGFSHSETDPDTPSLPPGLEETDHNDFCHVDFDKYSSMPPTVERANAGLQILDRLAGNPPNKSTFLSYKTIMKCSCVYGVAVASLWFPR